MDLPPDNTLLHPNTRRYQGVDVSALELGAASGIDLYGSNCAGMDGDDLDLEDMDESDAGPDIKRQLEQQSAYIAELEGVLAWLLACCEEMAGVRHLFCRLHACTKPATFFS